MKPPFPHLFPPPEIWHTVPPLSDRRRKIGIIRELGILMGLSGTVVCAAGAGIAEGVEHLKKPTIDTKAHGDGITESCALSSISAASGHLALRVAHTEAPVGTVKRHTTGPLNYRMTVDSTGWASLVADNMDTPLRPVTSNQEQDVVRYGYNIDDLPEGTNEYRVYIQHEITEHADFGGAYPWTKQATANDYCGKIALTAEDGVIIRHAIIE